MASCRDREERAALQRRITGRSAPGREHRGAVRLSWKSRHLPFGTILIGILLLGCLLPTILTIIALGPVNPIP